MRYTKLEEQLLIKLLLNLVIFKKLYLVKMCPIFDSSPPVFGARYQSFLRVCWFLHKGVPYFGYPSENLSNPTDISIYSCMMYWTRWITFYFLGSSACCLQIATRLDMTDDHGKEKVVSRKILFLEENSFCYQ